MSNELCTSNKAFGRFRDLLVTLYSRQNLMIMIYCLFSRYKKRKKDNNNNIVKIRFDLDNKLFGPRL